MSRVLIVGSGLEEIGDFLERRLEGVTTVSRVDYLLSENAVPATLVLAPSTTEFSLKELASAGRRLVLIGEPPQEEPPAGALIFPSEEVDDLARRLEWVLTALRVGLEPAIDSDSLVGDLALTPFLDLVRRIAKSDLTGQLELSDGSVTFVSGDVVAATAGPTQGIKAFCRLARRQDGAVRFDDREAPVRREIGMGVDDLVLRAIEDAQVRWHRPREKVVVVREDVLQSEKVSGFFKELLLQAKRCESFRDLLDRSTVPDGLVIERIERLAEAGLVRLEQPLNRVRIVTDSTCDLPASVIAELELVVVPLSIRFGDQRFQDGVEITARDFYELLETDENHPKTEFPAASEFQEHYLDLLSDQSVVSIHLSSKLSKTLERAAEGAKAAVEELDGTLEGHTIEVVDSQNASAGSGLLVWLAARMAARDLEAESIVAFVQGARSRLHTLFAVDTLDYLKRGGRIGTGRAFLGRLLDLKPILGVVDGEVSAVGRARGRRQIIPMLLEEVRRRVDPKKPIVAVVGHAQAPAPAEKLRRELEKAFDVAEILQTDIGPVIGAHAGPGCMGLCVFQPTDEEWEQIRGR